MVFAYVQLLCPHSFQNACAHVVCAAYMHTKDVQYKLYAMQEGVLMGSSKRNCSAISNEMLIELPMLLEGFLTMKSCSCCACNIQKTLVIKWVFFKRSFQCAFERAWVSNQPCV